MTTLIFSFCNMIIDYEVSIYKLLFCIPTQDSKIFMDTIAMASSVKPSSKLNSEFQKIF